MTSLSFYAGIHDHIEDIIKNEHNDQCLHPDFSSPAWDLIRAGSKDVSDSGSATSSSTLQPQSAPNIGKMCAAIDSIAEDLKQKLQEDNEQLVFGSEKFISRYNRLKHSLPLLTSALHRFGWTYGGSVTSRKGGNLRHGRRIAVQATAAGRRKDLSRVKAKPHQENHLNCSRDNHQLQSNWILNTFCQQDENQRVKGNIHLNLA